MLSLAGRGADACARPVRRKLDTKNIIYSNTQTFFECKSDLQGTISIRRFAINSVLQRIHNMSVTLGEIASEPIKELVIRTMQFVRLIMTQLTDLA